MTIMKFLRIEKGLNATDVARETGLSSMTIGSIELGRAPRRRLVIDKLETFYGRPIKELMATAVLA